MIECGEVGKEKKCISKERTRGKRFSPSCKHPSTGTDSERGQKSSIQKVDGRLCPVVCTEGSLHRGSVFEVALGSTGKSSRSFSI